MQPGRSVRSQTSRVFRSQTVWGVGLLVIGTVVGLVVALLYASPPWQTTVSFYTDDAASLRPGLQVRVAGIPVGKVEDLSLESDQVLVRLAVDRHVFVGEQSQVDVRMLTLVGGYFVNLDSIGNIPLGKNSIPRERVTMPYSLIQTLSDTTNITEHVKARPINESLNQIQHGLNGKNIDTVSAIIDAGNSLISTIEKQRGQVTKILDITNQWMSALAGYRQRLEVLLQNMSIALQQFGIYNREFGVALKGLGDTVLAVGVVSEFYKDHRDEFIEKVRKYLTETQLLVARNGLTVRGVHRIQNLLNRVFDAQNAPPGLLATDLCIPVPGSLC